MTPYLYYPGCSLEGTAKEYNDSTRAVMRGLGLELRELTNWTCCGASATETSSLLLALSLAARNLALAEQELPGAPLVAPCSACYLNLKKVEEKTKTDKALLRTINQVLEPEGLRLTQVPAVRHLLDVLSRDVGAERFRKTVTQPLAGLKIAPYYGCQCLRPYLEFDDPEKPQTMNPFIIAAGAQVFSWEMGAVCCGASLMTTKPEVGEVHVRAILSAAIGADAVLTVCPLCEMNLEAHQQRLSRQSGQPLVRPILYLPQFMGLAMGLSPENLGLKLNLSPGLEMFNQHDR